MSGYGLQVNNELGELRLSINSQTFRLIHSFTVGLDANGTITIPGMTGKGPLPMVSLNNVPANTFRFPHSVTISGDTLTYSKVTSPILNYLTGPSIIWVYLTS